MYLSFSWFFTRGKVQDCFLECNLVIPHRFGHLIGACANYVHLIFLLDTKDTIWYRFTKFSLLKSEENGNSYKIMFATSFHKTIFELKPFKIYSPQKSQKTVFNFLQLHCFQKLEKHIISKIQIQNESRKLKMKIKNVYMFLEWYQTNLTCSVFLLSS